jgi:hypothetical protein
VSSLPPPNAPDLPPQITVGGTGHNIIFGQNMVQGSQTTKSSSIQNVYTKYLAKHGFLYWFIHLLVALFAAALWEYRHWFLSLFK